MSISLKTPLWLLLLFLPTGLFGQFGAALPDWAEDVLAQADQLPQPPANADMWRLLDETIMMPDDKGRILVQRRVVQQVLTEAGVDSAATYAVDGDAQVTKIKRLKGWHRNSAGKVAKLDRNRVWTVSQAELSKLTHEATTLAQFEKVGRGSVVVFESKEQRETLFGHDVVFLLGDFPIAQRTVEVRLPGAELIPVNFESWQIDHSVSASRLLAKATPGIQREWMTADTGYYLPYLLVNYESEDETRAPFTDWTAFGGWYNKRFHAATGASGAAKPMANLAQIAAAYAAQQKNVSYRQRYLTPGRGWIPAEGAAVQRRKYGDCKDMVSCLSVSAAEQQVAVYPTLTMISSDYYPKPESPVSPFSFNHLIAAIPLQQSLGLAAEVTIGDRVFLLVDPTDKGTPLGSLPAEYRGRQVLVCLPQGGAWATVPDTALEQETLDVKIVGRLDQHYTLAGSMIVTSHGNALGLRTTTGTHHTEEVEWLIRKGLSLPGAAKLTIMNIDRANPAVVQTTCQISWPSFLRHDDDGYRLPAGIVPASKAQLEDRGRERQQPVRVPSQTAVTWQLSLQSPRALEPGLAEQTWSDNTRSFAWKASGGKSLTIEYHQAGQKRMFPKQELQAGIDYWENYRRNYNPFYLNATLFRESDP